MARRGRAWRGKSSHGRQGVAAHVAARRVAARQIIAGMAWLGMAGQGSASHRRHGMVRRGQARHRRQGLARPGTAGHRRRGAAWQGSAGLGLAGQHTAGKARPGWARHDIATNSFPVLQKPDQFRMSTIKYTSNRLSAKEAEAVGRELEKLASKQELTPAAVVQAARSKKSPLHKHIEWDESKAAESYRLVQAAWLIRTVKVEVSTPAEPSTARAFVRVTKPDAGEDEGEGDQPASPFSMYVPLQAALESADWRGEILADAKRDLAAFRRKYAMLAELAGVLREIDQLLTTNPAA